MNAECMKFCDLPIKEVQRSLFLLFYGAVVLIKIMPTWTLEKGSQEGLLGLPAFTRKRSNFFRCFFKGHIRSSVCWTVNHFMLIIMGEWNEEEEVMIIMLRPLCIHMITCH